MTQIDFENATFDEFDELAIAQLVFASDEISQILRGHLFIERIVETLISRDLAQPEAFFGKSRLTFDQKLDLARALGSLPDNYFASFKALNRVRNNYAHKDLYQVSFEDLNGLKFDWEEIQNEAFEAAKRKGIDEAAKLSVIFLCWKAINLVKQSET